jgi:murein DD-endopeptidase MepM/ murein hydrolase activator NlpD
MMKTILFSAALAIFAMSASAQTEPAKETNPVSTAAKESTSAGKEKGQAISELAKSKAKNEAVREDGEKDVKLTREERQALKAARKAAKEARKADLKDDGIVNGSAGHDEHGTAVRRVAKETTLEGKDKGLAVRDAARIKAKNGERAKHPAMKKPAKVSRPVKPAGAGRPSGAGQHGSH